MLGIPVALHMDAIIEAICTESNDAVRIKIINGQISASQIDYVTLSDSEGSLPPTSETLRSAQSDMLFVHFPLPFSRWYDDLTFT